MSVIQEKRVHELSVMSNILDIVVENAQKNNAKRVTKIHLVVGELSDLIPEWMQTYFDFVSKDTIADNAELVIEKIPAVLKCDKCGHEFTITREDFQFTCRKCESADVTIQSGREFTVKSIEID